MTNIPKYLVSLGRSRTLALLALLMSVLLMSALLMGALLPSSVLAASGNPLKGDERSWRFTLAFPMIWAPDIDGKIRGDQRNDFTIPFEDILDGLHFGLMGELYATRGPFGLAARFNYLNLKTDRVKVSSGITGPSGITDRPHQRMPRQHFAGRRPLRSY